MKKLILIGVVIGLLSCFAVSCNLNKDAKEGFSEPTETNEAVSESVEESSSETKETSGSTESTETTPDDPTDDWTGYY